MNIINAVYNEQPRTGDPTFIIALTALIVGFMGFSASLVALTVTYFVPRARTGLPEMTSNPHKRMRPQRLISYPPLDPKPKLSSFSNDSADADVKPLALTPESPARHVSFTEPARKRSLVSLLTGSPALAPTPVIVPVPITETEDDSPLSSAETLADATNPGPSAQRPSLKPNLSIRLAHAIRRRTPSAAGTPTSAGTPISPRQKSSTPRKPVFRRRATTVGAVGRNGQPSADQGDATQAVSEMGEILSSGPESIHERGRFGLRALKRSRTVGGTQIIEATTPVTPKSAPLPPVPPIPALVVEPAEASPPPVILGPERMTTSPAPMSRSPVARQDSMSTTGSSAAGAGSATSDGVSFPPSRPFHRRGSSNTSHASSTDGRPKLHRRFTSYLTRSPVPSASSLPDDPASPQVPDSAKSLCEKVKDHHGKVKVHHEKIKERVQGRHEKIKEHVKGKEPIRARTQPYGPPYNMPPPSAGIWGVECGPDVCEDERAQMEFLARLREEDTRESRRRKRRSVPADGEQLASASGVRRRESLPR